ncbi:MAG: hypothetical protein KDN18_06025 [Verrucomicrobiae bacterium]|nr:hypothetical protein [Verrucomicrobiae bacterium]
MKPIPTEDDLIRQLLHGEACESVFADLSKKASENPGLASRLANELGFSELLRQALGSTDTDPVTEFEAALEGRSLPIEELLHRVHEGSVNRHECDQVVKALWSDPEAARNLRRSLVEDEWLRQAVSESKGETAFIESLETRMWAETRQDHFVEDFALRLEREIPAEVPGSEEDKIIPFPGGWGFSLFKLGAAAAAIALGAFLAAELAAGRLASSGVAGSIVNSTSDAVWTSGASPRQDGTLRPGIYELKSGVVSLKLNGGGELSVEGPARFEVGEDASAEVHAGIALARLPEGENRSEARRQATKLKSRGLSVSEPARLIGIDAREEQATEAVVFNGDGGICLGASGKCRDLSEFEAVKVDHLRDRLVDVPYNPRAFSKAWELLAGVEDKLGPVRVELPGSVISAAGGVAGEVQVFVENDTFETAGTMEVDRVVAGEFAVAGENPGESLETRGPMRSYLLQLTPSGAGESSDEVETSLTFAHPVVGVIFSSDRLENSDATVGTNVVSIEGDSLRRGLESGEDEILLSEDRRTLNLRFRGGEGKAEQVRVLVALN